MHNYCFYEAIELLKNASVPVTEKAYGFSISHPEIRNPDQRWIECGVEHDSSISLSAFSHEILSNTWFFRIDFLEMANLIISAYDMSKNKATCSELIRNMEVLDKKYCRDDLEQLISEYVREIS